METHVGRGIGKYIESELFSAKHYVLISTPAVSKIFAEKLIDMTKNGIKIKVITSNTGAADSDDANLLVRQFTSSYDDSSNIEKNLEYKIVSTKEVPLIHAKIYVIDGKCAITGSANLTENSFFNFAEYIQITRDQNEIKKIESDYNELWNQYHDSELEKPGTKKNLKNLIRQARRKL
jgi:phosphatidylserine/phosphatidylglycerophosphate/cardiolipin synthase-like enzyme